MKAQRENDEPELEALKGENRKLREKIESNERTLDLRNSRHRDMQQSFTEISKRLRQLEDENQELRWQQQDEYPQVSSVF